jgi:hypothetical protein
MVPHIGLDDASGNLSSVVNPLTKIHACRLVQKSCTYWTIVSGICLCRSLLSSDSVATVGMCDVILPNSVAVPI